MPDGARVLDAGAGEAPYRHLFDHTRYDAVDWGTTPKAYGPLRYFCELTAIPVRADHYDGVICTQVLEHVREPVAVLAELHRVMRPGGVLWLSAPFFYEEHEAPYDYFRYTRYGLAHVVASAGFSVKHVDWLEGYYTTLAYQLDIARRSLRRHPAAYGGGVRGLALAAAVTVLRPVFGLLSGTLGSLGAQIKMTTSGHCKNYVVVATKA
jgi:SAM-dependent methyltransferase